MSKDEIKALEAKLAKLGDKGKEGKEKVEVLNDLAFAFYRSDPEKTKGYATQALALGETLKYRKGVAKSHQIIGISSWMRGDYEEALELYLKSLKMFEEEGDAEGTAASYRNIGNVHRDRGNNDQALEYYLKSLKICEEIGYSQGISASYNNIGIVHCERGDYEKALECYQKALKIREEIGNKQLLAGSYNNIGIVYYEQGNYNKALEYQREAFKLRQEIGDKRGIILSCIDVGLVYIRLKRYKQAFNYFNKGVELARETGARSLEMTTYQHLSELYEAQEDIRQAFDYYRKASELKAGIFSEESGEKIAQLQVRYEAERKEREAEIYRIKNVDLEAEIAERKRVEETLRESEEKYRTLQANMPIGVYRTTAKGEVIFVNQAILKMRGYSTEEELMAVPVEDSYVNSKKRKEFTSRLNAEGSVSGFEVQLRRKDGSTFWVSISSRAIKDKKGKVLYYDGIMEDITDRKQAEEELRIKDSAIEGAINGIALMDLRGNLTYVNNSCLRMWGYDDPSQAIGKSTAKFYQNKRKVLTAMKALRDEGNWTGEMVAVRKDGSVFPVHLSINMVKDEAGKPLCAMASFEDITERKRAEEELREREELYRTLVDTAQEGITIVDLDENMVFVNPRMAEFFGYKPDKLIGRSFLDFVPPEEAELIRSQTGQRKKGETSRYELTLIHKNGTHQRVLIAAAPLYDAEGKPYAAIGVFTDITDRKQAEEKLKRRDDKLRESEELYRTLVNTAQEAIILDDPDENIVFINPTAARLLGYPPEELIGRSLFDFIPPEEVKALRSQTAYRITKQESSRYELTLVHRNGSSRRMLVTGAPVYDAEGKVKATMGVFTDITELSVLGEIGRAISSTLDINEIYGVIHEQVKRLINADNFYIAHYDKEADEVTFPYVFEEGRLKPWTSRRGGKGMTEHVIATGKPYLFHGDSKKEAAKIGVKPIGKPSHSWLGVPMLIRNEVIGVMAVQSFDPTLTYSEKDMGFMETVAHQAAQAVENARSYSNLEQRLTELSVFNEIGRALSSTLKMDELMEVLLNQTRRLMYADDFFIASYDEDTNVIEFPLYLEKGKVTELPARPFGNGMTEYVISSREALLIQGEDFEETRKRLGLEMILHGEPALSWLGVPMISHDKVLGIISVQSTEESQIFDENHIRLLASIANQAAGAFANARAYSKLERRLTELSIFNEVGYALGSTLDLGELLEVIYTQTSRVMDTESFYIALYDENAGSIEFPLYRKNGKPVEMSARPFGKGLTEYVIKNRKSLLLRDDVANATLKLGIGRVVTGEEAKCWLGVPMIFQDRVIGVMSVQSTRKAGLYDEDHERLLSSMANQAAGAVANARAYSALERKLTELSVFNEVGRALGSTLQLDELMDVIYNQTSRIMDTESFYVALYDEKSNTVEFPLFIVDEGKRLDIAPKEFGNGLTEYVITSRKPLFLKEDVVENSRKLGIDMWVVDGETPQSWLGVPMISHDKVVGVMSVQSTLQANRYDEGHKRFLEAIANQAAGAVVNARAYSELERKLTELSVFNEISRALGSTLRLDELLEDIYAQITRIMKGDSFYIALYDADKSTIAFPLYVDNGKQIELSVRPFGKGLTEHVISTREPLLIKEDVTEIASKLGIDSVRHGDPALSWLGVPMISQDRIIGVMTIQSTRKAGLYDEDHERLLSAIANQAASAVVNARAYEVLEQRVAERTAELQEKLTLIQQQRAAILELSTPTIKVWDGVLVIPLIGALDTRRAQQLTEELLTGIAKTQSQIAIIDITGVPTVDSAVANHLFKTVESVKLLGAQCVITGIRPEVAQTIVHLGIDIIKLETRATLAEGLKWAFKSLNVKSLKNDK